MKKAKIVITGVVVAAFAFALVGTGCTWVKLSFGDDDQKQEQKQSQEEISNQTSTKKQEQKTEASSSPSEVVEEFLNATLGTLANANLDDSVTRNRLSKTLRAEYDSNSAFVPLSLCIQDGPSSISVDKDGSVFGDTTSVIRVKARYGSDWMDMWDFQVELTDGEWKIFEINCLQ